LNSKPLKVLRVPEDPQLIKDLNLVLHLTEKHGSEYLKKKTSYLNILGFVENLGLKLDKNQETFLVEASKPENSRIIVCAARRTGKSFVSALLTVWLCFTNENFKVLCLAASFEEAKIIHGYCRDLIFRKPELKNSLDGKPTVNLIQLKNKSQIRCLPASEKQVRGQGADLLILDECALMDEDLIKAAIPTVASSPKGKIVLLSTPRTPYGFFYHVWVNSEQLGYKKFHWTAETCPRIDKKNS